jgi:hypothetical protein
MVFQPIVRAGEAKTFLIAPDLRWNSMSTTCTSVFASGDFCRSVNAEICRVFIKIELEALDKNTRSG